MASIGGLQPKVGDISAVDIFCKLHFWWVGV